MAASAYYDSIQKMYMAFYGRPADPTGLETWAKIADKEGGMTLNVLANFVQGTEAQALYGNKSNAEVVNAAYNYLFGRDAEPTALTTWAAGVSSSADMANLLWNIMAGAAGADKVAVDSKLAAAKAFTASVDTTAEILAFNGAASNAAARSFLATVKDADTLAAATAPAALAASVLATTSVGTSNVGQTFTLTSGTDYADTTTAFLNGGAVTSTFKFTSGNESVNAAGGTFAAADILVDNATTDNDTLNATLTGSAPIAANLTNIETLKLNMAGAGAGLDFAAITGAKSVEVSGTQNGTLSNVAATAPEMTLQGGYDKTLTVAFDTLAGTSTSNPETLKVNLNGVGSKAALQVNIEGTTNTGSLEQLTINSAGTAANTLTVGTADLDGAGTSYASASGITKFTVTGDQALTLKTDHATISTKTVEKTGTGALTLDIDRGTATTPVTSLAQAAGYSDLVLRGTGDVNVSGIANGATVTIVDSFAATNADSLSVKAAATGTADSLTLVLDHKTDATNISFGSAAFAVNDIETLTIKSNGGDATGNTLGDTTGGFEANAAKTVNLSGDTKLTLNLDLDSKFENLNIEGAAKHSVDFVGTNAVSYAADKNVTVNASAATAALTLNLSQVALATAVSAVETMTVTTGTGADAITVGSFAGAKLVLDAGNGGDSTTAQTVTAGDFGGTGTAATDAYTSASTITTGTGKDTITVGNVQATDVVKASLAISAGDGDNTVVVKGDGNGTANISGEISVTTGTGKDTIVFGASSTAANSDLESSSAKVTITTGAGDDVVKLGNVTKNGSTVDLGEGNDKVYVGIQSTATSSVTNDVVITTGAGADTVYLYAPDGGTAAASQKVVITDFTAGTTGDVLNLNGWVGTGFATAFDSANTSGQAAETATGTSVEKGLFKLGAFDAAKIVNGTGADSAFKIDDGDQAIAVLFNNNTGLTEVWIAYDADTSTSANIVVEKMATLENVTLTGIADLKIENFSFAA